MELHVASEFEAPADAVWRIVGNFYGLHRWFPGVTACERDEAAWGEVRRAALGDRVTPERLEAYDAAGMSLAWTLVDVPLLGDHRSTLTVTALSPERSRADWVFFADLQPPLKAEIIEENTRRLYGAALQSVKATVENKSV